VLWRTTQYLASYLVEVVIHFNSRVWFFADEFR
jgi:hypothetical protein